MSDITSAASTWQHFVAPLWQYDGMTVQSLNARFSNSMSVGAFDMQIANAVIIHGDGTVTPLINSTTTVETLSNVCSATSITSGVIATPVDPSEGIHYFIPDQVGTTIYEFGPGGWPVWHGAYTPFGQEIVNGFEQNVVGTETADGTYNRYKFTGKERDTESGLDYFGARYYSSSMGRWISPDWSDPAQPVPYASLDRPQTLNLYSYGINNPVSSVDDDGHSTLTYDGKAQTITLRESDGTVTTFQASNNPQLSLSIGKLVDGNYEFLDTQRPHLHDDPKDDTRNGPYGSYGIFRLKPFKGADGKQHDGVGLHSGRADSTDKAGRSGYCYATNGCVRTSDFAMWYFSLIAPFDPLTTLTVQNNRPDPADDHGDHPDPNPDPGPKPPPHLIPRQNRGDDED